MREAKVILSPENSVIFVMDPETVDVPTTYSPPVAWTESSVMIGTLMEHDGPTTVTLLDPDAANGTRLLALEAFDGDLVVPSGRVAVMDALRREHLTWPVKARSVRVQIYTNHSVEPDEIVIVIEDQPSRNG